MKRKTCIRGHTFTDDRTRRPCLNCVEHKLFSKTIRKDNGCWEYTGQRDAKGYGYYNRTRAHRLAYELRCGAIPEGLCVCHSCDNPPCINPDHLWLGTQADNQADKYLKRRSSAPSGEQNHNAKLTELQVRGIKRLLQDPNANPYLIATDYGVSFSTIFSIRRGQTWKHVQAA